ncbi:wings apart-like protein homolog isoform X2 [Mercenaria mercenaria]|nr:wings apart-like protein homolog isoform X2 [Mercenaria mercenaria]
MAEVKRYGGRSYSKNQQQQESSASKAFDEIFAKPKATNLKWGNASYAKPRNEDETNDKKQKGDLEEPSDPFSFEFDSDKSPKKKPPRLQPRTVVMQPAVRITSASKPASNPRDQSVLDDDTTGDDLIVKKGNVRTYTKRAGRKIKEEQGTSQSGFEKVVKSDIKKQKSLYSTDSSQETTTGSSDIDDSQDPSDDLDGGLYIESDDGSSVRGAQEEIFSQPAEEEENIFKRPKRDPHHSVLNSEGEEITVKFRSHYLNPDVYSKFTENVTPKDPVGALSNSKVVHKNVLKHDSGTTLIVVCSPKVGDSDIKQTNTQTKYFKDNIKDIVKAKNKPVERLTRSRRAKKKKLEEDPYELEDNAEPTLVAQSEEVEKTEGESQIAISSTEESQLRQSEPVEEPVALEEVEQPSPKMVDVEEVVKHMKAAPPRKYHRIFRSRNKGFMEPLEAQEVTETVESNDDLKTEGSGTDESQETLRGSQENGRTNEEEMDTHDSNSQESEQGGSLKLPVLISISEDDPDSDVNSSQQSAMSDSQGTDNENSSQELTEPQPKKPKMRPPPAERKIFRARGSKPLLGNGAQKKIFSSPKKAAAVYNVRSWQAEEEMPNTERNVLRDSDMSPPALPEPPRLKPMMRRPAVAVKPGQTEMPRLTRAVHWQRHQDDDAYTSVHVSKEHKDLFTVVKNVKEAHECQEHGETQEFDDDIEYLLAGIESIEPMSTRCLSCVGLAQKCTIPAFRMHLRAHGTVTKIFLCLQDAAGDPSLALCTSALMFMLSRDRLNMDLDQESLNLMLRLLGVDQQEDMVTTLSPAAERALKRNKDRVLEIYKEFLQQTGTKQDSIDMECLSTGNLAMESLLSLTSRRAGEWFKEELRSLGALDHIVDTVCSCIEAVGDNTSVLTNSNIENLKKVDRCLRVLENVTYLNGDNQNYLISYKGSCLIPSLSRALRTCQCCLSIYPLKENVSTGKVDKESFGWVVYSCILAILRVLLNLTHDNDTGCMRIGEQGPVIETVLLCILQSPQYATVDLRFDLYVLSLGLLINLVEHSDENRIKLLEMNTQPMFECADQNTKMLAYLSLVEVFCRREQSAQQLEEADEPKTPEKSPNKSGEWRESDSGMEWIIDSAKKDQSAGKKKSNKVGDDNKDLDDEETFTKALHKAGKHMENSIVAAYVALLVGCLIQGNKDCSDTVKQSLPQKNFEGMIYMLKKFLGFMNLTSGSGSAGGKSIERVIEVLEKC